MNLPCVIIFQHYLTKVYHEHHKYAVKAKHRCMMCTAE